MKRSKKELKKLFSLVKNEAKKLKKKATSKELDKLSFTELDPVDFYKCIYGQITGDCFSGRAIELIEGCCKRVYANDTDKDVDEYILNGKPKKSDRTQYWSPIEVFIATKENQENGNNKMLVRYLKGKEEKLRFVFV